MKSFFNIMLAVTFISVINDAVLGQNKNFIRGVEARFKSGFLLPHRPIMHHLLQGHSFGGELGLIGVANGKKEWHQAFNYPKIGGKLYFSDFGNPEQLGWAVGTAFFGEFPYFRNNWLTLNFKLSGGLAYVTKKFDQQLNPKNNSISTHLNSLIILGMNANVLLEKGELGFGVDMTHLSNGATKLPNLGINVPYLSIAYTQYLEKLEFYTEEKPKNSFLTSLEDWHFSLLGIGSTKQIYPTGGRNYPVFSFSSFLSKKIGRKAGFDFALEFFYNESVGDTKKAPENPNFWETTQIGSYLGYFIPVNKLRIAVGMGYYLKNDFNPDGPLYHRLSLRYKLYPKFDIHFGIKSHWGRADYFEYGLMYRLF